MSNIGGVKINTKSRDVQGNAYGHEGVTPLPSNALTTFIQLAMHLDEHDIVRDVRSSELRKINESYFNATICKVNNQALLLMVLKEEPEKAYVFDPVNFTYLGGLDDAFDGTYRKVWAEHRELEALGASLSDQDDLTTTHKKADQIAKATASRQQAASEFLSLKQCAETLILSIQPHVYQQLAGLCALFQSHEQTPCQAREQGVSGVLGWFKRALG